MGKNPVFRKVKTFNIAFGVDHPAGMAESPGMVNILILKHYRLGNVPINIFLITGTEEKQG